MPWFCEGCGGRRGGICKKWCRAKYGNAGAERIPPLDGLLFFDETPDNQGTPRYELMKQREQSLTSGQKAIFGNYFDVLPA